MNLVAAASELKPQFSSDNSAAAVSGITGDANLHAPPDASPVSNGTIIGFAGCSGGASAESLIRNGRVVWIEKIAPNPLVGRDSIIDNYMIPSNNVFT
jgi:hypothetical protein